MRGERNCPHCGAQNVEGRALCAACGGALEAPRVSGSTSPSEPGRYIGRMISQRYRVVERIARGGMGEVYVAEHVEMRQLVAVKFLHKRYAHDESFAARFFNEARYAAQVTHPNAVALYDFGRLDDGTLFIVMEYVRGESLSRVVRAQGMIPVPMAIRVASQVAEVLASAHEKRIIHRDVKPDNIMLVQGAGGRVSVKVLDFGIAKILDDEDGHHTEPGVMFGTPEYMSPEQAMGRSYDHRVDVYALGLVLYYMLAGSPPFSGSNKMAVLQAQVRETAPPLERSSKQPIPKRLVRLIESMLAKAPSERPADMIEVFNELDAILAADELEADIVDSIPLAVASFQPKAAARADYDDEAPFSSRIGMSSILDSSPDEVPQAERGAVFDNAVDSDAANASRNRHVESAQGPSVRVMKGDGYSPLRRQEEARDFAPIRHDAEEPYSLTGVQLTVAPLSFRRRASDALARTFRKESGWLLTVAVAICSMVVFLALTAVVQHWKRSTAPLEHDPTNDIAGSVTPAATPDTDDSQVAEEPVAGGAPSAEGAVASVQQLGAGNAGGLMRHAGELAQAEASLAAGNLAEARRIFSAIPITEAPAGFSDTRNKILRAEALNRSITESLSLTRCDEAKSAQQTLAQEFHPKLAASHAADITACEQQRRAASTAAAVPPSTPAAVTPPSPTVPAARPTPPPASNAQPATPKPVPPSNVTPPAAVEPPVSPPVQAPSRLPDGVQNPPVATPPIVPPATPVVTPPPADPKPAEVKPPTPPAAPAEVLPPMEL